jgi:hypothetical protein
MTLLLRLRAPLVLWVGLSFAVSCGGGAADATDASVDSTPAPQFVRVPVDLAPMVGVGTAKGAYLRKITDEKDLIGGIAAQGRVGDYLIGNGDVRFIIQGPDRHSSPCPWGGTVLDADIVRPAGEAGHDNMGEHCLLFNLGRTQLATDFEIVADGSKGGAAVLAVTGPDTLLDFINLPNIVSQYLPGVDLEMPFDPDQDEPVTITRYFVLRPAEHALRVTSAFRNDGDKEVAILMGEFVESGGSVAFFNPLSTTKGFGYKYTPEPVDYLAFRGDASSHFIAVAPLPNGKPGAACLTITGCAGCMFGTDQGLPLLLAGKAAARANPATLKIAPGAIAFRTHLAGVGTGELATVTTAVWQARGTVTGTVTGRAVEMPGAKPLAGVRISAIQDGRAWTQFITAADGTFSGALLPGKYQLAADASGREMIEPGSVEVKAGETVQASDTTFGPAGRLEVLVRTPDGAPMPAKVTVYCEGECQKVGQSLFDDVSEDPLPAGAAALAFAGPDGKLSFDLVPGDYRVVATRGPTYSLFPPDGSGAPVTVGADKPAQMFAELGKAVDTSGWLSGDFHVHGVNSPDSPVANRDRVLSFLGEGHDVLVSTDHDYVTDYGPYAVALEAGKFLATVQGVELTTFDYGHYNAFPLVRDPTDIIGGVFDWGGGEGPGHTPPEILAALLANNPGERVVQVNHPDGGYLSAIQADLSQGISLADPTKFRMPAVTPDPVTGDTGLFTTGFTAMELMNGQSRSRFATIANWWYALLSRGVKWTGTAVTDTHDRHSSLSGGPRTWVYVGAGKDTPTTFDVQAFAHAVNGQRAFGSNGPFVRMTAWSGGGAKVGLGETLAAAKGTTIDLEVEVQTPDWMPVDTVELYRNPTDTTPPAGERNETPAKPWQVQKISLKPEDKVAGVAAGTSRWLVKVPFQAVVDGDGYFVAYVSGSQSMPRALMGDGTAKPFAFTNPIFVDADGGGYDKPPLGKLGTGTKRAPPPPRLRTKAPEGTNWLPVLEELERCNRPGH